MDKIKTVNICPKCFYSDYYISNDAGLIAGQIGMYICNNCGFSGSIFPQIDLEDLAKLKKNISPKPVKSSIKRIKPENNKPKRINLTKIFIVLLFIFLTYTSYRFGLFDFINPSHEHAVSFFPKYVHLG